MSENKTCDCLNLQPVPRTAVVAGSGRVLPAMRWRCEDCNRVWYPYSLAAHDSLMLWPQPRRNAPMLQQQKEIHERYRAQFVDRTGLEVPPVIPPGLIYYWSTVKPDSRILCLGDPGALAAFTFDTGGLRHEFVCGSAAVADALAPTLTRTTIHPWEWRPGFGVLYDGIVVCDALPADWWERLPRLLRPNGDCWLIGAACEYAETLVELWGIKPLRKQHGKPHAYVAFLGDFGPLGEGPGTELHDDITALGIPECQQCRALARQMNEWGADECERRLDQIVEQMLPRLREWWTFADKRDKARAWWRSNDRLWSAVQGATALASGDLDPLFRDVLRPRIVAAIVRSRVKRTPKP